MPSPVDTTNRVQKRKKACRRCRHRKQKCDFEQPCHNCVTAEVECTPVVHEAFESYPTGYVQALENHAALLEQQLNGQFPGSASDHLEAARPPIPGPRPPTGYSLSPMGNSQPQPQHFPIQQGSSPDVERSWYWQNPQVSNPAGSALMSIGNGQNAASHPSPPDFGSFPAQTFSTFGQNLPAQIPFTRQEFIDEIPTATAASFFRTYFQLIHPQYPFLDVKTCGEWYTEWKIASVTNPISGWPAFFVKMIFSIGSLIQSKSDNGTRYQHQDLKSQAQSEDFIIRSTKTSPLFRLQAMLLQAMYSLHSESTARIAHTSGAIMRFATLNGFHRLVDLGDDESQMKIRAWSCAYVLERAVSATLDVPVSVSDAYISTALFINTAEPPCPLPWLDDAPPCETSNVIPTLDTFAHICKIRLLQSYIMHSMNSVALEGSGTTPEWVESMRQPIENWASEITLHSFASNKGYQSPQWLGLISQLSRLLLCRPTRLNINTHVSDIALQASCDACTTFRALQKMRQIAQPWLVVLTQFQAGVTILYITWARAVPISKEADLAIRDCTSVLAILADRWQNAEHYRDCFEVLARAIPRSSQPGYLEREARDELADLTEKVVEAGCHRHVKTMLWEMASSQTGDDMDM